MSKDYWFRFHIARWRDGTFGLSAHQKAAYLEVMCELYDHAGFIKLTPALEHKMALSAGMRPTTFKRCVDALIEAGKIDVHRGNLTCRGVTREIQERQKLGQKLAESRRKSAEKAMLSRAGLHGPCLIQNTDKNIISNSETTADSEGVIGGAENVTPFPGVSQELEQWLLKKGRSR